MRTVAVLAFASVLVSAPAQAIEREVELTPFVGWRGGATLDPESVGVESTEADPSESFGLGVDFLVRPDARVEIFVDRQRLDFEDASFDLTVDYLQAGAVYEPPGKRLRPFVGLALGLTRFDSDDARVDDSVGLSASLGGGFKIPLGARLALRLELRGHATLSDTTVFAVCGPGCEVGLASDGWYQLAGRVGLAIRLGAGGR